MTIPDVLWHYTDAGGLRGIVSSGVLRLTDVRFLNDRTERTYGAATVRTLIDQLIREGRLNANITDPNYAGYRIAGRRLYICSLTECSDSLSQWQRYAADGYGYCIGFETRRLRPMSLAETAFRLPRLTRRVGVFEPPILRKMMYDIDEQAERTRLCVSEVLSRTDSFEEAASYLNLALEELSVQFKNPLFEDEREWRLIQETYHHDSRDRVQFASRGPYVRPYIENCGASDDNPVLPIKAILCGPRLDAEVAIETVQELLSVNGDSQDEVEVRISRLHGTWR